jgi:hypothetical protein
MLMHTAAGGFTKGSMSQIPKVQQPRTGFITMIGSVLIFWKSSIQTEIISQYTLESEYFFMALQLRWLNNSTFPMKSSVHSSALSLKIRMVQ